MQSLFHIVAPPGPCSYLHRETASLEYEMVKGLTAAEYQQRLLTNWRRFGMMLFKPRCPACTQCRSLRIDAAAFRPNRSQRRAWQANEGAVELRIEKPSVSRAKLNLYDRYHQFQADHKEWPWHAPKDIAGYRESFVHNPPFTEEWNYYLGSRLIGVGYVDRLPCGLSAIYFFYDPDCRHLSLGTWNVLSLLDDARRNGLPHLYLGYYVAGCPSLEYKANFHPNEVLELGQWRTFKG